MAMNSVRTQTPDSDVTTEGIRIRAAARYQPDQSNPDAPLFLFSYKIYMENIGRRTVRLRSRHWIIRDAFNERDDVRGAGVVGEYPLLAPGERYEYESSCPLRTRWGTMEGSYTYEDCTSGDTFDVAIGRFFLVPTAGVREASAEA